MDEIYMDLAIALAKKGIGSVNPNPLVGAVIVKNGEIIGMGYHAKYGKEHAERNAVLSTNRDISGSTIYVTLEPCTHYGKQPPCTDLLIEKKFKRVVIGMLDPNILVSGRSINKLKEHGIEVKVGVREEECKKMNEIFIKYITTKLPFVLLKSGISLDGKIATVKNESKWITCEKSRKDSNKLRSLYSSILVGVNTVIEDDPCLTSREETDDVDIFKYIKNNNLQCADDIKLVKREKNIRNPVRIILDSNLRIPLESKVVNIDAENTIIAVTDKCNKEKKAILEKRNVKVITVKSKDNRVDLKSLMFKLGEMNIDSVLIEGGGRVNFSAIENKICDKVRFYIAPKIIGGEKSKSCIGGRGFESLIDVQVLNNMTFKNIDSDLVVEGYI